MTERKIVRQGDILFVPTTTLPEGRRDPKRRTVVTGEATGHAHRISGPHGTLIMDENGLPVGIAGADPESPITHEEHGEARLTGDYNIVLQEEYAPEGNRRVID